MSIDTRELRKVADDIDGDGDPVSLRDVQSKLNCAATEIDRLRGVLEKIAETGGWPGGSHADAIDLANDALADGEGVGK